MKLHALPPVLTRSAVAAAVLSSAAIPCPARAEPSPPAAQAAPAATPRAPQDIARDLESYMNARAALGHFSGAALVAKDGQVLLSRGYGFTDASRSTPNTPDTIYRVASLTKQFTAMAIMLLEERSRLHTADKLSAHLPDVPEAWADITLDQLLTHTSGIPDYEASLVMASPAYNEFMGKPDVAGRVLAEAKLKPLDFAPGARAQYSNTGYIILGFVVERASGVPFDRFLQENIFAPLGMTSTRHDAHGLEIEHRAVGHELTGEFSFKRFFAGFTFPDDFHPAPELWLSVPQGDAGLITTAPDLFRWDEALATERLVSRQTLDRIFTPRDGGYGYGWIIDKAPGRTHIYHNGVLPGFFSRISRYPDERFTIILLGNTDQGVDRIAADLALILRNEPCTFPVRREIIDLPKDQAAPLIGAYRDDQGRILEVAHDGDMLTVALKGRFVAGLLCESPTRFFGVMFNGPVTFETGPGGAATTIDILLRGEHWRASRITPAP